MAVKLAYEEIESEAAPIGWGHDCLGNLCTISSGTTPLRSAAERYYRNGTIHWVKTTDLTNSDISATEELVTKTALDETSLKVYPVGIVLVAMYGGFNQIGRTGLLKIPAAVNQAITAIQPNPKSLVSEYLINVLNFRVSYWKTVASSSRKDPNITSNDIKKFPIIFPSIGEQQAIATALSDVDALITSLDKLIAKKRDIKQATMQQLLTGKIRLPGFSGKLKLGYKQTEVGMIPVDWEVTKLGKVADVKTGPFGSTLHEKDYVDDGTPIITVEHLSEQGIVYVNLPMISAFDRSRLKAYSLLKGDIVFSRVGSVDRNSLIEEAEDGWLFSGRLLRIRIKTSDICSSFLNYYFNQEPTKQRVRSVAVGQTMASLNTQILRNIDIAFPSAKDEQQAIATVLSDMDAEITALEQKRDKTRALKQGMMQELLTGKTRLL